MSPHVTGDARKRLAADPTTTHARALAALDGARAAHTIAPLLCDLLADSLRDHAGECSHHILGAAACRHYGAALRALGVRA